MALPLQQITFSNFGGINVADQQQALIYRSHGFERGALVQFAPVESPSLQDMDFLTRSLGKRRGSAERDDLTGVLVSGDTLLGIGIDWEVPGATTHHEIEIGVKAIYVNTSGTWAVMLSPDGVTDFAWQADIAKCSLAVVDNHLVICPDVGPRAVYRTGGALDDMLRNSTTATTVDASSASGQKVLNVTATTSFRVWDRISIDDGAEFGYVASIQAGVSLTLIDNLGSTYTNEAVAVANQYTESFGGALQTVTGDWDDGTYIAFEMHERLLMCTGDNVLTFTDSQQPWDRANGGFRQARGNIVAAMAWLPRGESELLPVAFLSTTTGPEFYPGFDDSDAVLPMGIGGTALSYRCLVGLDNWIAYLTRSGGIEYVNMREVLPLGRRLKNGTTGPLDTLTTTNTAHTAKTFGIYFEDKKQAAWFYPDASRTTNSHAVLIDNQLGEPLIGEGRDAYEAKARPLVWAIDAPDTNAWFVGAYNNRGTLVGILANGKTYTINSGNSDLDTLPIREHWEIPDLDGGAPDRVKSWRRLFPIFRQSGDWIVTASKYLDLSDSATGDDVTFSQLAPGATIWGASTWNGETWAGDDIAKTAAWLELYSHFLRLRLFNQNQGEFWVLNSLNLQYQVGSIQD